MKQIDADEDDDDDMDLESSVYDTVNDDDLEGDSEYQESSRVVNMGEISVIDDKLQQRNKVFFEETDKIIELTIRDYVEK